MKRLSALVWCVLEWAVEGGFGRFVYKTLAWVFLVATVSDVAANGLTYMTWVGGVLVFGMLVGAYGDSL